jgi:hypothetical protein
MLSRNNRIADSAMALHQVTMPLYRAAIALQAAQSYVALRQSKFDALRSHCKGDLAIV